MSAASAPHATCADGPYEAWVYDRGRGYKHPGLDREADALTCVFEADSPVPLADLPERWSVHAGTFLTPVLWKAHGFASRFVPGLFVDGSGEPDPSSTRMTRFCDGVGQTPVSTFGAAALSIRSHVNYPVRDATVFSEWADGMAPAEAADGDEIVIVAIIDDGIPFAHRHFANAAGTGTRIDYCWSQSATRAGRPMLFGREFDKNDIDTLYSDHNKDEGAVYAAAGLAGGGDANVRNPLDRAFSHGAHVLDSLAGQMPGHADPRHDRVHIIAVDLPAMASAETSGFGKDMFALSAMHYIFDRAERIAAAYAKPGTRVPLIVNLSYGHSSGPHDGTGLIEAAFDEMIAARRAHHPTAVILPSGNMFMQSIHAVMTEAHFATNGSAELDWFQPPADRTSSYLEIWLPDGVSPSDVEVELLPPQSTTPCAFPADGHAPLTVAGAVVGQLSTRRARGGRWCHVVALAPTDVAKDLPAAPAGRWTLRVTKHMTGALPDHTTDADGLTQAGGVQFWVQRDEDFGAAGTGARQSYFIDPKNALYADDGRMAQTDSVAEGAMVRRFGTMSGMATGRHVLRVGGYDEASLRAAIYSCAGALRVKDTDTGEMIPAGAQVQLSAVSERSFTQPGIVGAGTRTGTFIAQSGTSSAAPQVARALVDVFLDMPPGDMRKVADYLEKLDRRTGTEDPKGADRLGEFIVRRPRASGQLDEEQRIGLLVQPRSTETV